MRSRFAVSDLPPEPEAVADRPRAAAKVSQAEVARRRLLRRLDILDTLPEQAYDDIVALASHICQTPIAAISLIDSDRQWFKAERGLGVRQTDRDIAFCARAVEQPEGLFIVEDAQRDGRFAANPLVTGGPKIRFYAGAPIRMAGGEVLGTVCVVDTEPRQLNAQQRAALAALSRQATQMLSLRLERRLAEDRNQELAQHVESARIQRLRSTERLEMVLRGGNLGYWDLDVATDTFRSNDREFEIVGHNPRDGGGGLDWTRLVHPDDRSLLESALAPHLAGETDSYGCEHRLRHHDGHWVWVQSRAVIVDRNADGSPLRIVGTHMDISTRVESLQALQSAKSLLQRMGAIARIGGWEYEPATGRMIWTDEVYRIYGIDRSIHPTIGDALSPYLMPGRRTLERALDRAVRSGSAFDLALPLIDAEGQQRTVSVQGEAVRVGGLIVRLTGTFQDITERKAIEQAAAESRRQLGLITDNVPALIAYIDAGERYRFINATMRERLGARGERALGHTVLEVRGEACHALARPHIDAALRGEKTEFAYTDDTFGPGVRLQTTYVPDIEASGRVRGFYAMTVDITELHETQRRLEELAGIDVLTGLPNRRRLNERLDEAILRVQRSGGSLALLFLDVDRFKSINDSLGHAGGDAVLREFADRLRRAVRSTDTVARVAGDEFVVLAEGAGETHDVESIGQKIVDAMRVPFQLEQGELQVSASIGIAVAHREVASGAQLLARADTALYAVKRRGRNGYAIAAS